VSRRRLTLVVLAALVLFAGAALVRVSLWRPLALEGEAPADGFTRVSGVVHVHTSLSDGGGTPREVIAAARAAGLAFLCLTEHNNVDPLPLEGYHDGLLVLAGAELSTPSGHLLGLGLDRDPPFRFNGDGLDALEDVRDLGGVSFAAHPFSPRADLRWTGWELPGPWGIELINGDSEWRRAGPRLLLTAALYGLNAQYALLQSLNPPDAALRRWDEMLARRSVVGIAGADAHSRMPITKTLALRFPAYEALFRLNRIHLLLDRPLSGDAGADRSAILSAIRRGRFHIGLDGLAPASQFAFTVQAGAGRWTMGETAPVVSGARAQAGGRMPAGTKLILLRDGKKMAERERRLDEPLPGAGVYRVEARVPGWSLPWIISNPIALCDEATRERREAAARWPEPTRAEDVQPLSALPGTTTFTPEFDPTSWMDAQVADPGGGPGGTPALKLAFRLGERTAAQPFTWCALVNRQPRDLAGFQGLHFRIRGDGEYRSWVQVRDVNPASSDGGLEWWLASVRTSTDWREVFLPFARFRTINPKTDGRLDAEQARAIVFVLDHAAVKTGTQGVIWIADLGVYK
jgi:hypothetical protein